MVGHSTVNLDGVRVGGDKGVEAGEGGGQGEGNGGGGERGPTPEILGMQHRPELERDCPAMCAGQGRAGRAEGKGGSQVSGQHALRW